MSHSTIEFIHPDPYQSFKSRRAELTAVGFRGTEDVLIAKREFRRTLDADWQESSRQETWTTVTELRRAAHQVDAELAEAYRPLLAAAEDLQAARRKEDEAKADAGVLTVGVVSTTGGATWEVEVVDALGCNRLHEGCNGRIRRGAAEGMSHPHYHLALAEARDIFARINGPKALAVGDVDQQDIDRVRLEQSVASVLQNR